MTDKKKIAILVTLGAVMLSIGAFQFTKLSAGEAQAPKPAATQEEKDKDVETVAANSEKNDLVKGSFPERDPFRPLNIPQPELATMPGGQVNPQPTTTSKPGKPWSYGDIPPALPGSLQANPTGTDLTPVTPEMPYRLSGIIVGAKPAAVFVDAQGAQRLIQLGGSLDGETVVSKIERRQVVLRVGNKTHTLTLGGEPSEN